MRLNEGVIIADKKSVSDTINKPVGVEHVAKLSFVVVPLRLASGIQKLQFHTAVNQGADAIAEIVARRHLRAAEDRRPRRHRLAR